MVSELYKNQLTKPSAWLVVSVVSAFLTGLCLGHSSPWWVFLAICSICCATAMMHRVLSLQKRMRYVMEATLSGDFSYRFPAANVNGEEREVNETLNRIVEHFERLTNDVRQNEAFLARMINLTDVGLAVADANGDVLMHNDAALRLLERTALTSVCQVSPQAFADLNIRKSEMTVNDKSFSLLTISDLSRQMQAVEVESWEKLTRVLTHEIMNSLTPIQSIADTMGGKASAPEVMEAFETISSSSQSLMQFVRNFREFSRLPEPHMKALYLKPLLESSMRMAESFAKENNITISLTCFPPDLMVYTDESLLSQVLLNILKNAIEANSTRINIEADEKADESVEIRISNDGEPIPDEAAEHIFTPFFTTRESGSGIGLSLSRRIITHLGGTLSFRTHPSTSFSIRL